MTLVGFVLTLAIQVTLAECINDFSICIAFQRLFVIKMTR